jgi:hypothetical protein
MKASSLCFPAAVLMVIVGMGWGIAMAISQDHSTSPAHAHLNLLGWVSLFLIGVFYRLHPDIDRSRLAFIQVLVWIVAVAVMTTGIALLYRGAAIGEPLAAISSMVLLADMLLFAWLVLKASREAPAV